ncbi:MAG: 3-deoxy-D-manno-octulosonic acid kinase, partial [Cellvibrionaceae bacterium]
MTIRHQKNGKQHILYCEDSQSYSAQTYFNESLFQPDALKTNHLIYRTARGRGCSYFFRYRQQQWVLRHYWRGGWMRNINRDAYCWQSLRNTRAYQELALLQKIQHWQLPAPTAIAARICYGMGFYRADIITGVIPNSQTLVEMLGKTLPSPP